MLPLPHKQKRELLGHGNSLSRTAYKKFGFIHENGLFRIEKHRDETLVFSCHFGVPMVMIGHLLGISTMNMWHGFNMQPTSVTVLGCEEREGDYGFFRCHVMGCTKHLAGGNEPISNAGYFTDVFQGLINP